MSHRIVALVLAASALLAGCASLSGRGAPDGKPADGLTCADASYNATLRDGAAARQIAESSLLGQLADLRGAMVSAGLKRLRYEHKPTQCAPIGREIHCKASASVCGR